MSDIDFDEMYPEVEREKFDVDLLKGDLKTVLRRAFSLENEVLDSFVEFIIPNAQEWLEGFPLPEGKNVYSFLYTVNLKLEGSRKVRGLNVREAKQNLLRELTQELSIKDLLSNSTVIPYCPFDDIEIKEPLLLHGIEPTECYLPYAYMPRDAELLLEMERAYEMVYNLHETVAAFGKEEKAELIAQVEKIRKIAKRNWAKREDLDIDQTTIEHLKTTVKREPEKTRQLLKQLKKHPALCKLLQEMLEEPSAKE